jgi:signal transduction histidine kinase/CheY-like chemotaxis protein/AraC-like DNA-binding protein
LEKDKSRQRAFIWATLATLALLFFIAVQIYRSYRRRTSDNKKLTAVNTTLEAEKIITEQQLAEESRERERLNEMDAFKTRFFTNISHEFRTPLTVILGMAEQLEKGIGDKGMGNGEPSSQPPISNPKAQINLIKRNGQNLLRLINEILDLAKLENNSLKMNYVQGDILPYLRYIAESMHSLADTKNVVLKVESSPEASGAIMMDYDPERLLQIVHNLLSNAIKFTPSGGNVVLQVVTSVTSEGLTTLPTLKIAVSDTGIGIAPEELPLIFDRFFQTKNQERTKSGGSGIGLSLTKELVKVMGGDISVESTLGKGTTFNVVLPITNKAKKAEEPNQGLLNFESLVNLPESTPPVSNHQSTNHQLLIIEDNPDVVEYLAACLGPHYQLDFAYNGQAGIEKAIETVPDLIISDVMMPEKDGFEVTETLKNDERTSHIPIVLLTAKATVTDRIAGLRRGADAYLAKPFVEEELLVVAANLLESRRKLQVKYSSWADIEQVPINQSPVNQSPDLEDVFLKKTIALIDTHLDDAEFGNAELSRKMLMSESQLHRKIKALTDQSLSVFIRSVRLRRSRVLLQTTELTVSEVAFAVGFTDPAYFSRTFSAEFGAAPTAFRKG